MRVYASAPVILGPGFDGGEGTRAVLCGEALFQEGPYVPPAPELLSANERRRTSLAVRLALAAAARSAAASGVPATQLASVFGSSNGDGTVVAGILDALATGAAVSPTMFHNSVHNAAAGYWAIGAASTAASTSVGSHDATFAAAFLNAAAHAVARRQATLLCVYDAPFPGALQASRPTVGNVAVAMVLSVDPGPSAMAALEIVFRAAPAAPTMPRCPGLGTLFAGNAAARALPLLEAIHSSERTDVVLELIDDSHLHIVVHPCLTTTRSAA
jgi:hypothetical protein